MWAYKTIFWSDFFFAGKCVKYKTLSNIKWIITVAKGLCFKGIVHLNTTFLYMKFNKIYNLNHPVYWKLFMLVFSCMYINTFCILYYNSHGWLHLEQSFCKIAAKSNLSQNLNNIVIWLHLLFGFKASMEECFLFIDGFRYFVKNYISDCLNEPI